MSRNPSRRAPHFSWIDAYHARFLDAVEKLGGAANCTPSGVFQHIETDPRGPIPGLELRHVKSHLQTERHRVGMFPRSGTKFYEGNGESDDTDDDNQPTEGAAGPMGGGSKIHHKRSRKKRVRDSSPWSDEDNDGADFDEEMQRESIPASSAPPPVTGQQTHEPTVQVPTTTTVTPQLQLSNQPSGATVDRGVQGQRSASPFVGDAAALEAAASRIVSLREEHARNQAKLVDLMRNHSTYQEKAMRCLADMEPLQQSLFQNTEEIFSLIQQISGYGRQPYPPVIGQSQDCNVQQQHHQQQQKPPSTTTTSAQPLPGVGGFDQSGVQVQVVQQYLATTSPIDSTVQGAYVATSHPPGQLALPPRRVSPASTERAVTHSAGPAGLGAGAGTDASLAFATLAQQLGVPLDGGHTTTQNLPAGAVHSQALRGGGRERGDGLTDLNTTSQVRPISDAKQMSNRELLETLVGWVQLHQDGTNNNNNPSNRPLPLQSQQHNYASHQLALESLLPATGSAAEQHQQQHHHQQQQQHVQATTGDESRALADLLELLGQTANQRGMRGGPSPPMPLPPSLQPKTGAFRGGMQPNKHQGL